MTKQEAKIAVTLRMPKNVADFYAQHPEAALEALTAAVTVPTDDELREAVSKNVLACHFEMEAEKSFLRAVEATILGLDEAVIFSGLFDGELFRDRAEEARTTHTELMSRLRMFMYANYWFRDEAQK